MKLIFNLLILNVEKLLLITILMRKLVLSVVQGARYDLPL